MTSTMRFDRWQNSLGQPYNTTLQVVQVVKTDVFAFSATSMTDITGLAASITPRFASSKILVQLAIGAVDGSGDGFINGDVTRNGTQIGINTDATGSVVKAGWAIGIPNNNKPQTITYSFLDSPASVSTLTYQSRVRVGFAANGVLNRYQGETNTSSWARTISTITLTEIAQ